MRTEEQKAKHAAYMREYNARNKDKINAKRRKLREQKKKNDPEAYAKLLEQGRRRDSRYYQRHKDAINARAKARNWNYDPEKAKVKRARYQKRHPARGIFISRRHWAKKHSLPFDLTEEWYYNEFEKGCSVTGIPFDESGSDTPWVAHIDRIIPEKGYVEDNCRLVCACYNLAKKHWSDDDVIQMSISLLEHTFKE